MAKRPVLSQERARVDAYERGSDAGHTRALRWLANPHRGDGRGTLANEVFALAEALAEAPTDSLEHAEARGAIAGFCYAVECPAEAAMCRLAAAARESEAANG